MSTIITQITGIRRLEETTHRSGQSGDNWHMTWADDDKQYVALCDGRGWPGVDGYTGADYNSRVYAIRGDAPQHILEHMPGYPDLLTEPPPSPNRFRYYGFGILATDGYIYQFLSAPNHWFDQPGARFVGAKLIYSPDNGRTWRNQDSSPVRWETWEERSKQNMVFFNEPGQAFALLSVLQMGRDYQHNEDGYIYVYAPNGNDEGTMNQLVMFRVRNDQILERSAYEFFVSCNQDGSANWCSDIADRGIVHTFPSGWVNTKIHPYAWHPSVVYNAPLGVYMMANWGMGRGPNGLWFEKPSYLGFLIAERPWGPWTQVHEETAWMPLGDPNARAYQPQISPKWIAQEYTDWRPQAVGGEYSAGACQKQSVPSLLDLRCMEVSQYGRRGCTTGDTSSRHDSRSGKACVIQSHVASICARDI